jgi:hypothetical protein
MDAALSRIFTPQMIPFTLGISPPDIPGEDIP